MRVLLLALCVTLEVGVALGENDCCRCPALWTFGDGHCYRFFNSLRLNFEDAEKHCQSYLSHLVRVHHGQENDFIFQWWKSMRGPPTEDRQYVRIGYFEDGDYWRWTNVFNGGYTRYTNWDTNQPDNSGGQFCAVMWRSPDASSDSGKWDDEPCDRERAFMCEYTIQPSRRPF